MVQFLQQTLAPAYEQYFTEAVERPLRRQRARALQDLYQQQAMRGVLRSGVGMYPITQLEQSIVDVLGREGARLALAQAQTQTQLEEAERQRAFQRELLERQIEFQRQILDEQRRLAEQQMWGQLLGIGIGALTMPVLGGISGAFSEWLLGKVAPTYAGRISALEQLLRQYGMYYSPYGQQIYNLQPLRTITAGVEYVPVQQPVQPTGQLTIKTGG